VRSSIEAERARLGMTKGDMSSALGVTLKTYGNYIRGGVIPSDILEKLADMTGCSIDYLLERAPRSDAG
jgi:transcriptional regulator with XRE-family HTH domain